MPMKQPFEYYWTKNIYETTSGNFWTPLLDFHAGLIGADRILVRSNSSPA
jgi:2,3-dihydroxybenzoate decarboxylase